MRLSAFYHAPGKNSCVSTTPSVGGAGNPPADAGWSFSGERKTGQNYFKIVLTRWDRA